MGDATPLDYLEPEQRYIEKLATPDVTIADIIGSSYERLNQYVT